MGRTKKEGIGPRKSAERPAKRPTKRNTLDLCLDLLNVISTLDGGNGARIIDIRKKTKISGGLLKRTLGAMRDNGLLTNYDERGTSCRLAELGKDLYQYGCQKNLLESGLQFVPRIIGIVKSSSLRRTRLEIYLDTLAAIKREQKYFKAIVEGKEETEELQGANYTSIYNRANLGSNSCSEILATLIGLKYTEEIRLAANYTDKRTERIYVLTERGEVVADSYNKNKLGRHPVR